MSTLGCRDSWFFGLCQTLGCPDVFMLGFPLGWSDGIAMGCPDGCSLRFLSVVHWGCLPTAQVAVINARILDAAITKQLHHTLVGCLVNCPNGCPDGCPLDWQDSCHKKNTRSSYIKIYTTYLVWLTYWLSRGC